jgi:Flp pilus assembly protein TadB
MEDDEDELREAMGKQEGMIRLRTALILFAILTALSLWLLKGVILYLTLILIAALAGKSYVHHLRKRID